MVTAGKVDELLIVDFALCCTMFSVNFYCWEI